MLTRCPVHLTSYVRTRWHDEAASRFGWQFSHLERGHRQQEAAASNTFRPSHHPVAIGTLATLRQTYRRENPTVQYAFETFVLNVFAIRTN